MENLKQDKITNDDSIKIMKLKNKIEDANVIEAIKTKINENKMYVIYSLIPFEKRPKREQLYLNIENITGLVLDFNDDTQEFTIKILKRKPSYFDVATDLKLNYFKSETNILPIYIHSLELI